MFCGGGGRRSRGRLRGRSRLGRRGRDSHVRANFLESILGYAANGEQVFDALKASAARAEKDDRFCGGGAGGRQVLDFLEAGCVEVERMRGRMLFIRLRGQHEHEREKQGKSSAREYGVKRREKR